MVVLAQRPMYGWLPRAVLMLSVGDAMVPQKVPPQESLHEPMHARVGMSPLMTMRVRRLIALGSAKLRSSAPVAGSESAMLQRPDGQTMARPRSRSNRSPS